MTSDKNEPARVLAVALDATTDCRPMLDAAAALAAALGADLRGVWVQDDNLHRLAGLPFVRELAFASDQPRPLNSDTLRRTMTRLARRLESTMAASADRRRVRWELRARRGDVEPTLAAESTGAELLIVGHVKRLHHVNHASGQVAFRLCAVSPVPVLLLPVGEQVRGPVGLLLSDSTGVDRAPADVAMRLARRVGGEVLLLHSAAGKPAMRRVSERMAAQRIPWRSVEMVDTTAASVSAALRWTDAGILIVATEPGVAPDTELLARTGCPLLIVRG